MTATATPSPTRSYATTKQVPLKEDIHEYFDREVKPHVPDAWIDDEATKIGYEIPLNRHFYKYVGAPAAGGNRGGHQGHREGHHEDARGGDG